MKSWKNDESRSLVDLTSFWQHYFLPASQNLRLHTPSGVKPFSGTLFARYLRCIGGFILELRSATIQRGGLAVLEELNVALSGSASSRVLDEIKNTDLIPSSYGWFWIAVAIEGSLEHAFETLDVRRSANQKRLRLIFRLFKC